MDENWGKAFTATESYEGWHKFSNDRYDPGGATYSGVIQTTYDSWRRLKGLQRQSVEKMTDDECRGIMYSQFWLTAGCDKLPHGVDVLVYDISVNSGPSRAVKMLQQSLGITADGVCGVNTLAEAKIADAEVLLAAIDSRRTAFWQSLKTWWRFGKGWSSREVKIYDMALNLVRTPPQPSPPIA